MSKENLLKELKQNPFSLAPMAGITDCPFRSFMKEMGCGIVATELVSAKSLQLKNPKSHTLMRFTEDQRPVGVQIFGEELSALENAAQIVEQAGADFVDLNFGCPVTKIIKKGAGSAVLKDLGFLRKILKTVKKAVSLPVSIKVRTGWDKNSRNSFEVARIAKEEGIIWLAIHGRTRSEGYSGHADWNYIAEVKKQSPLPVIGNGDLTKAEQILRLKKQSACDGMMIGRGCLKNPWIFQETKKAYQRSIQPKAKGHILKAPNKKSYMDILSSLKRHLEAFYNEPMFLLQYKKFSAWYSSGYPKSSQFRQKVFQSRNRQETLNIVQDYFSPLDLKNKEQTKYEPALMQGHG